MKLKVRNYIFIFFLILILGFSLRLWSISSESYWLDEAISIKQAQQDYGTTLEMVKNDIHLPLHISLLHVWVKLFGTSEFASRYLSLIFGTLSIWIGYLLAKKLFSEKVALITSILIAVSPIMIYYSQEARPYSLFVLLTLLSFYFYINYIDKKNNKNLFAYGFFTLLLIYTHVFSFLVLLVQNSYLLYKYKFQIRRLINWFISQFVLFLLFIPMLSTLFRQVNSTLNTIWIPKPNLGILIRTFIAFFGNVLNLSLFILLLFVLILTKKFKASEKSQIVYLTSWIFLPFVIVLFYSFIFSSVYNMRYMLFTLPAFLILFSVFIEKIPEKKKYIKYILISVIILSSFISVVNQVNTTDKDDWRTVSDFIQENVKENDVAFINPFYHHYPFTYYYDQECFKDFYVYSCNLNNHKILSLNWMADCCNDTTKLTATDGKNELKYYVDKNIWLISVRPELYDINNSLYNYFDVRKKLTFSKEFGEIKIYKFE